MLAGAMVIAAPWYLLCLHQNGAGFWKEFFWRQQFERFFTPTLQHVQPVWFYVPIVLAGLFPWIPLVGLLFRRKTYQDVRVLFLAGWLVYALVFFSAAKNKLPGYVLPLLPALAIILAFGLSKTGTFEKWWVATCALLLVALPVIAAALPNALLEGIRKSHLVLAPGLPFLAVAGLIWYLGWREKPLLAMAATGIAVLLGVAYFKRVTFPALDQQVSVRGFWRAHSGQLEHACFDPAVRREWQYGLNYYSGHPIAICGPGDVPKIEAGRSGLALQP